MLDPKKVLQARPWPKKSPTPQNVTQKKSNSTPQKVLTRISHPKKVLTKISHPKKVITKFQTQKKSSDRKFQTQKRASHIPVTYIPEYPPWDTTPGLFMLWRIRQSLGCIQTYIHFIGSCVTVCSSRYEALGKFGEHESLPS